MNQKHTQPKRFFHAGFSGLIGVAKADITPPVGIYSRNWGAAKHDVAEGIHRPFYARVLTLQDTKDGDPLVLVSLDLGWWRSKINEWHIRGGLIKALGLDADRVLINLTHTHSGPSTDFADAGKPGGQFIAPFLDKVRDAVIEATRSALEASTPSTLEWTTARCSLAQNRDLPDPAVNRIVCGFSPENSADDTVLVGRVCNLQNQTTAVIANYACHPTTLAWQNKLLSPDWPGAFCEKVEEETGAFAIFLQGASGELQPKECFLGDTEIADAHGRQLAHAVLGALEEMLPRSTQLEYAGVVESGAPLAMWQRAPRAVSGELKAHCFEVELELKDLPTQAELAQQIAQCDDRVIEERLARKVGVRAIVGDGTSTPLPVWCWQIGEAIVVAQRDEAYSPFQTKLRETFPEKTIIVMNLTNGSCGYLPPCELYSQDVYQVWQSPYAEGGLEKVIGETTDFLKANFS